VRLLAVLAFSGALLIAGGCASLPESVARPPSATLVAPPDAPLAAVAREAGIVDGDSGFRPMLQANFALDARLEAIRRAHTSLDVQTYLVGNDSTGRLLLRELRAAAARGVRVRLLLDDLYTEGMDDLLLGFAAFPNVEVRLFNPFAYGREDSIPRFWHLATDFHRLNHRMHNKLFVADGALAIAGGRNLADEYFLRSGRANFIDFEMLMVGAIVPQLSGWFDAYWNSEQVYPIESVTGNGFAQAERRAAFDRLVAVAEAPSPPTGRDMQGRASFGTELDNHRYSFARAAARAIADRPDKALAEGAAADTVADRYQALLQTARSEVIAVSPYFVPGRQGVAALGGLRERGVAVRIVTNSGSATDEPLVSFRTARYRPELLAAGVQLFEVESVALKRDDAYHDLLGRSRGRLHAKLAILDRETVLLGSMNLDPRSARINTEIGLAIRSAELARQVLPSFDLASLPGLLEVRLRKDGRGLEWVSHEGRKQEHVESAADASWPTSVRLFLLSIFVAEDQL
jgi:phosphatidylserine/phosphatidylglycerophosphate/cardiolipin synthase-like enzyme